VHLSSQGNIKALVESQRAIDAMLLQHINTGNAELAGEQNAMGRMSMSNGDRSMFLCAIKYSGHFFNAVLEMP
jgi:hypothetical protein